MFAGAFCVEVVLYFSPLERGCYRPTSFHYWSTYAPPPPSAPTPAGPCVFGTADTTRGSNSRLTGQI
jgi:hypothetical protein